jgi:hypothetical protein
MPAKKSIQKPAKAGTGTAMKGEPPSSFDFYLLARAVLDAADAGLEDIRKRDEDWVEKRGWKGSTFMVVPVCFLYLRGIELALKAAIREKQLATPQEIRSRGLGHDLAALLGRALSGPHGFSLGELGMDQSSRDFVEKWSDYYAHKMFEYVFDPFGIPEVGRCREVATAVVGAIQSIARTLRDGEVMRSEGAKVREPRVEEMDMSPLVVREFAPGVVLREPLSLTPMQSEDGELLRLEYGPLDIDVFAATRSELQEELREQLAMLWTEFALEDDEKLSGPAVELKKRLWNRTTLSAGHGA